MRRLPPTLILIALLIGALALSACGSSKKKSSSASTSSSSSGQPATLSISAAEKGKKASYSAPASTKGGLVTVTFQNNGKAPHSAQLVKVDGNHTPQEVLKAIGGNSTKTPSWIHGEGGPGNTNPGQTSTSTDILPAGKYLIVDGGNMNGPPGYTKLSVTAGASGSLPTTGTTVTATAPAKDKYKWQISGPLKAGQNKVTFTSKGGKDAVHLIAAARVTGNPSKAQIAKAFERNGPPPKFIDQKSFTSTSVLDGTNKSEVTSLSLTKAGKYVIFCPLTDRDGGKPHLAEGLLTTVTVK
jgi:plastocyanin